MTLLLSICPLFSSLSLPWDPIMTATLSLLPLRNSQERLFYFHQPSFFLRSSFLISPSSSSVSSSLRAGLFALFLSHWFTQDLLRSVKLLSPQRFPLKQTKFLWTNRLPRELWILSYTSSTYAVFGVWDILTMFYERYVCVKKSSKNVQTVSLRHSVWVVAAGTSNSRTPVGDILNFLHTSLSCIALTRSPQW